MLYMISLVRSDLFTTQKSDFPSDLAISEKNCFFWC